MVVLSNWDDVVLQLADKSGKIVFQKKAENCTEDFYFGILAKGMYFFSAIQNGRAETKKIQVI